LKKSWTEEELLENYMLLPNERHLVLSKKTNANRLGFAVLLKYFQKEARFPSEKQDISKDIVQHLAHQIDALPEDFFEHYRWGGKERSYTDHRKIIRDLFGFREITSKDNLQLIQWLKEQVQLTHDMEDLSDQAYHLFRKWKVEPPSKGSLKRMIHSAIDTYEKDLYDTISEHLSAETCFRLDALLDVQSNEDLEIVDTMYEKTNSNQLSFRYLLSSACKPSVNTMETELKKLLAIQQLEIPPRIFQHLPPKLEKKYRFRAATETVTELRAHPSHIRYTLLAILFSHQYGKVIDSLADLLDEITLKIKNRAKNTTRKEAIAELERVKKKTNIL